MVTVKVQLEVENFGPVARGKLLIKPLTVFVGPNNTGKSHIAMLYYALLTTFTEPPPLFLLTDESRVNEVLPKLNKRLSKRLKINIERAFSSKISDLIRWGSQVMEFRASLEDKAVEISCHISAKSSGGFSSRVEVKPRRKTPKVFRFLEELNLRDVHYLPASRAGLLHNYRAIVGSLIRQIPFALFEGGIEIPEIPGVVADFLAELVTIRHIGVDADARAVSEFFEREIAEGELVLELRGEAKVPELSYRAKEGVVPLYRMSSMLVELAPLGVYLKYGVLKRGDFLIIEEPESHLHPDKQVKVAELLAMLVNKLGLNVLVTTHSDVLLAKLSNLVALNSIPEEVARTRGFNPELAIDRDKIAVYSFRRDEEGVVVEEVKVTEEGIPDDVFRKVIEELYEESMELYYRIRELAR